MTSRDRVTFHRWTDALIPTTAPKDRDGNRSNYMTWGLVTLPGNTTEYSVYATEAYYAGPESRVRRFTFRVDGFVSVHAPSGGGNVVTKPLRFRGKELVINMKTAEAGSVRVELQSTAGAPVEGFRLDDCPAIRGDAIEHTVSWKKGPDVRTLAGTPIRAAFEVNNADLYSFRFR
jgi:hypothetical protein